MNSCEQLPTSFSSTHLVCRLFDFKGNIMLWLLAVSTCIILNQNNDNCQSLKFVGVETSEQDVNPSWKDHGTLDSMPLGISTLDSETLSKIILSHCFGVTTNDTHC